MWCLLLPMLLVTKAPVVGSRTVSGCYGERVLLEYLFDPSFYSKYVRPNDDSMVLEVAETTSEITLILWFSESWNDQNLRWNPTDFDNITHVHAPADWIWRPDLVAKETVSVSDPSPHETYFELESDGTVQGRYPSIATFHCRFETTNFPFDKQSCLLRVGSYAHPDSSLKVLGEAHVENIKENPEWKLLNWTAELVTAEYEGVHYSEAHYVIKFERNAKFYIITLVIPSSMITILSIIGTFGPYQTGLARQERVSVGITTFLTMSVLLMVVAEQTPKSDSGYPFMGEFFFIQCVFIMLHSIMACIIQYLNILATYGVRCPKCCRQLLCFDNESNWNDNDTIISDINGIDEDRIVQKWYEPQRANYNEANRQLQKLVFLVRQFRQQMGEAIDDRYQAEWNRLIISSTPRTD